MSEVPTAGVASGVEAPETASAPPVVLRIERGNPTDEELAALVTVLSAAASVDDEAAPSPETFWNRPAHRRRAPRSWVESRLPR